MKLWRTRDHSGVDAEQELRSLRPRPRDQFVAAVVAEMRASRGPARFGRLGMALALTGVIVVSVASFGGISYASSPTKTKSSADAQYAPFKPPAKKPTPTPPPPPSKGTGGTTTSPPPKSSGLPFTGLTLWIPMAGGIVLMVLGIGLRWQGRRRPEAR